MTTADPTAPGGGTDPAPELATRVSLPPHVVALGTYQAGKRATDGTADAGRMVKLSSNENPLGPSPAALAALAAAMASLHRYPDISGMALREALARHWGLEPANVTLGTGAGGVLANVIRTFTVAGDEAVTSAGSFVGFAMFARAHGVNVVETPLRDYAFDLPAMVAAITPRTRLVYLANPNNPTGTMFSLAALERFLAEVPPEVPVIVDEAYAEYVLDDDEFPDVVQLRPPNAIAVRTFSKAFGLAGIRLGYGIGPAALVAHVEKVKLPFEPGVATSMGIAALGDAAFLARTVANNRAGLRAMGAGLDRLGVRYVPSHANFVMLVFESPAEALHITDGLAAADVLVRPLATFGVPEGVRVTVGLPDEVAAFLHNLASLIC